MDNRSIIGKQVVDVVYDGEMDPFAFRDELSWFCTSKLIPAIEKLFSKQSGADTVIAFETLSIDIGELPSEKWQTIFIERVIEELSVCIGGTSMSFQERWMSDASTRLLSQSPESNRKEITVETSRRETLFFFLKHGTLPWYSAVKNKTDLNLLLLEFSANPEELAKIIQFVSKGGKCLQRLVYQFDNDILDRIIVRHTGMDQHVFDQLKEVVKCLLQHQEANFRAREMIYSAMFSGVVNSQLRNVTANVEGIVVHTLQQHDFLRWVTEVSNTIAEYPLVRKVILSELKIVSPMMFGEAIEKLVAGRVDEILSNKNENVSVDSTQKKEDRQERSGENDLHEEACFVNNAGLVILHPFLPMLFENVGYLDNKKWISVDAQHRALMLTQYMVKSDGEYVEFDLMLNKILIGYPLEDTFPSDLILSDFEKQEAADVLMSVIKHWTALKNTGVAGLQSEFLQREAKLVNDAGTWHLKVEQKTSDVLMNRLPWGISMIRTPWMKTMMQVEWI